MDVVTAEEHTLWQQVTAAFERLEPLDDDARAAGLARLDPVVRLRVAAMLASLDATGILDRDHGDAVADHATRGSLDSGSEVGAFTIDAFVGRGGMGEVYRARRTDPSFRQQVALKLLRIDAVTDAALFARERRVLSRLEHPAIARLIDGGITPSGRSWMAMAFVEGRPLDAWCRERGASLDERLRLFGDICDAVAFAHANLVVHRDLKPANVLVDANGRVQLLDFGIAKLLDGVGDDQSLLTSMLMTPQYAAPEQLEDGPITVATDVHALGILLHELLTGAPPWRATGSLPAVVRRILADDPEPPSRVAAANPAPPVPAATLCGDLDAIVLKALRKDPAARYASVADLVDDVLRSRQLRPVAARAGSRRYRVQRYLFRNRWAIAAVSAVVLAVLVGTVGVLIQSHRAAIERDAALAEARRSDSIVQTLTLMLGQGGGGGGGDLTLKQTLDAAATRLLGTLDGSARSAATVAVLSDLYVNMQDAKGSYDLLRAALARGIGRDDPAGTARLRANLADAAMATGAPDDPVALLDAAEAVLARDPERNADALQQIVGTRAGLARRARDYDRAIGLLRDALPTAERIWAANDSALLTRYNNLLIYLLEAGRFDAFATTYRRAERLTRRPDLAGSIQSLGITSLRGVVLLRTGHAAAAERLFAGVAARRRTLYGRSPGLATDLTWLARARLAEGRLAEARAALAEARPMAVEFAGPSALPTLSIDLVTVQVLAEMGDIAGARRTLAGLHRTIDQMPPVSPLHPQLALAEAVVELRDANRTAARRAAARARAGFVALGPAGWQGLSQLGVIDRRIATLR